MRWVERLDPSRAATALAIAQAHGLPELIGRLLAARGADAATLSHFLDPSLRHLLPDPASLQDMEPAAERFARAIVAREPIAIFGDYDVDGAASVALIQRFLRGHGQIAATYIPDRLSEGYGPTPASLAGLAEEGARIIITVDCGTAAGPAIEAANRCGAEIIVVDHHQADEELPPAFAVLNPNRQDDLSGQGHLAAAGAVFLFLVATVRALRGTGVYRNSAEPDLLGLLDLGALATVCDVVPLKGVNRALVAKGLKVLRLRDNAGLRALADTARIDAAPTCYTLGFILGPRINAGGRVGASGLGAKLLASDDESETRAIAAKLEALNGERKAIEERMLAGAFALADRALNLGRPFIWLGVDGWHKGLIGLVAGRVAELDCHCRSWPRGQRRRTRGASNQGRRARHGRGLQARTAPGERRVGLPRRAPRRRGRCGHHLAPLGHRRCAVFGSCQHGIHGATRASRTLRGWPPRAALRLPRAPRVARAHHQ